MLIRWGLGSKGFEPLSELRMQSEAYSFYVNFKISKQDNRCHCDISYMYFAYLPLPFFLSFEIAAFYLCGTHCNPNIWEAEAGG